MFINVGEERITSKRDLTTIFPKEFSNRLLINQFIQYILNNFFEKSDEKIVSGYIGEVVKPSEGDECYIIEPTLERQMNQIMPILKTGDSKITLNNYIANLHNDGCKIYDQNKLLSGQHWSWCPPIDVDMYTNFTNYFWIGWDREELKNFHILTNVMDVEEEVIGQKAYSYRYLDENGLPTGETLKFVNGMRVCFINDTKNKYNHQVFVVSGLTIDDNGYLQLKPATMPLGILANETNTVRDIIGKKNYYYTDTQRELENIQFLNGMRIMFLNDENEEYNNKVFIVDGVGTSIQLYEDNYDPYSNVEVLSDYIEAQKKKDYFVMDRNCLDGNKWSKMNRWIHKSAISAFCIGSFESNANNGGLQHGAKPILCFNRDMELYNYGTFSRGVVLTTTKKISNELNSKDILDFKQMLNEGLTENFITDEDIVDGAKILLITTPSTSAQLYTIKIMNLSQSQLVILNKVIDDRSPEGLSVAGDNIEVLKGQDSGRTLFFDGNSWISGQVKHKLNQKPLFNLYDTDKVLLDNPVNYPESTFKGCTIYEYTENTDDNATIDVDLDIPVVYYPEDNDYLFTNTIKSDEYKYTPLNEYERTIDGYRFYKINGKDEYYNDWHLNKTTDVQYLKTQSYIAKTAIISTIEDKTYYEYELDYNISTTSLKNPCVVYDNGISIDNSYIIVDGKNVYISTDAAKPGDLILIKFLTDDDITEINDNYCYEYPLSLVANQYNEDITEITYNETFDQMVDIITNQKDITGYPTGDNNYSSIEHNTSVGSKIVQNVSSIIKSMALNDSEKSSVRNAIFYEKNAYVKFKQKFQNLVNKLYLDGKITDDEAGLFESDETLIDPYIVNIINQINIGKEGLQPFYNNGVTYLMENGYIPSTPAFIGIANCYEPRIETWEDFTTSNKPTVIICHDGSYVKASNTIKDQIILRFEKLIYDSINPKFKDTKVGLNYFTFFPGKFRKDTYSENVFLLSYSQFFETWCVDQNVDYRENINFDYDDTANPDAWKTWNYTGTFDKDGNKLKGSYRAIYVYYYDTYRPDTHPWEMLGFGDKPSWWEEHYGKAPYTSSNRLMWQDIEDGYIRAGEYQGTYPELARPGLIEDNLIPVDNSGKLKSPMDIGIIENRPTIQNARKGWVVGDIGDLEFAYLQTSDFRYDFETLKYFLKPLEWLESGWNTIDREVLFRGTNYEQVIDSTTNSREDISKIIMHNELVDGVYVRKTGIQQWISDYLVSDNLDISTYADKIRKSEVCLGYRCAGFYQKDTVSVSADAFGELPEENVHLSLINSQREGVFTYSAMAIQRTKKGYMIDGYDKSVPYFKVRKPEVFGKKSQVSEFGHTVYYYHNWKDEVELIPYKKEYTSVQDVYNVIIGYGKYLEENEKWYFNSTSADGIVLNFRTSGESFLQWVDALKGEESIDSVILLNPGVLGIGNYNSGIVDDLSKKIFGEATVLDINSRPILAKDMNIIRMTFNTFFAPKNENMALIKFKCYDLEHLLTFDNKTVYGDVLYDSKYYTMIGRLNVYGIKVNKWYGTVYAPGYIVQEDGAIANYDKKAKDLLYIYDTDDARCQGKLGEYSRAIVGYNKTKTYKDLYKNDKAMFDFYKGVIREKGTKSSIAHMNRTRHVSSTGREIELYEKWAFREGEFGHIKDNSVVEFILDAPKMNQNPQVITFLTAFNNYYSNSKLYNAGDVVIYNNYEYICKYNEVMGEFNYNYWKKNRYVGNYIVFGDDDKFIKQPKNVSQVFKYTDNLLINPIGGFAQTGDCEYIVANEEELSSIASEMKVGETAWIVKTDDNDWDIRKKTGVNKFVSMRYFSLEDAIKQNEYDYVYHFTDDKKDYYTNVSSDTEPSIQLDDIVYEDIDLNKPICRWCDIGKPEYTGYTGQYVYGTDYKVKLYNSVFVTQVPETKLNNGTPFTELKSGKSLSYSNMLLSMAQFGTTTYKYRWLMTLYVQTKAPDISIKINDVLYKNPKNNKVELVVCEGDVIDWTVSGYGCGSRSGHIEVQYVDGTTNQTQNLKITVPLSYRPGSIIYEKATAETNVLLPFVYEGKYEVSLVGAGGGAGGGSTKKHHKHGGGAGAGGSYLHGKLTIEEADLSKTFYITCGKGGKGGTVGHTGGLSHGSNGGDSVIIRDNEKILIAQGGAGGCAARCYHASYVDGRRTGTGGVNKVNTSNFELLNDSKAGNNGCGYRYEGYPGLSVYPKGNYGKGGAWVYKGNGKPGNNGYVQVKLLEVGSDAVDYSVPPTTQPVSYISKEQLSTDSMDYSSYYQPYIIKPETDGTINYFYSYDVLYDDGVRENAEIVTPSSMFYRNRAKSITAYHRNNFVKGELWIANSNKSYKVGDKVTVQSGSTYKYYICETDNVAGSRFIPSETIGDETIIYWREYSPTYYYKIIYNKGTDTEFINKLSSWVARHNYKGGDKVSATYGGGLKGFICKESHTSENSFDISKWNIISTPCNPLYYTGTLSDWKSGVSYTTSSRVIYNNITYKCNTAHTSGNKFVISETVGETTVTYWKRFNVSDYYKLYEDAECTQPAEKNTEPFFMTVGDLDVFGDSARPYTFSDTYELVDQIGTYTQISPVYLTEPVWQGINQVATNEIVSGGLSYYVNSDKETIEADENSLIYTDVLCQTPVQAIIQDTTSSTLKFKYEEAKYVDYTKHESPHYEPSYELKDNDNLFYTSKSINELTNDTELYAESELINKVGIYSDYIPVWERTTVTPNKYENTVKSIEYNENENSTYVIKLTTNGTSVKDFFYTYDGNTFIHLSNPSVCNLETGKITYNSTTSTNNKLLELWSLEDYTVVNENQKPSSASNNKICHVTSTNNYYIWNNSQWNLIGTGAEILTKNQYFKRYRGNVIASIEENTSILYPEVTYTGNTITQGTTSENGDTNNNIKLYFDEQEVGKSIDTGSIIEETINEDGFMLLTEDFSTDVMYNSLNEMYRIRLRYPTYSLSQCYEKFVESNPDIGYVNRDELIGLTKKYVKSDDEGHLINHIEEYCTDSKVKTHIGQIFNMYRNVNNKTEYTRLYKYGNNFYKVISVYDSITNVSGNYGICLGDINSLTTYTKIDIEFVQSKQYHIGDICEYESKCYICINDSQNVPFSLDNWELYIKDKIVNVILYKERNDLIYITNDSYDSRNKVVQNALIDGNNITSMGGTLLSSGKKGWMKIKYINEDYLFNLEEIERERIRTQDIKSCYLVDNENDETIVQVQVFDPIQNIVPNNVLDEVNYISSLDPVNDYNDSGAWNDNKVGYLWWDTSKVRYVDYYQGDYEYRRKNWGKQLPGSEIAIMEWTKSYYEPTDGRRYVEKTSYNHETSTVETYFYFWEKNPVVLPNVSFRKSSAFAISRTINNPTDEGIVWMSPIDANVSGNSENTLVLCNYNNAIGGEEAVLQINMDSDVDIQDHTEWVMVKENSSAPVPDFLWEKMRDSLLCYKDISGERLPVPDESLAKSQRIGIAFRPRQTMFKNVDNARQNLIQCINDIFASRTDEELNNDMNSGLDKIVDTPKSSEYYDIATTKLEMMSWKDETLIGKNILVENDESLDGIWAIYRIEQGFKYTLINYQRYNIKKYITYNDWYKDDTIQYITPIKTVTSGSADAKLECEKLEDLQIVEYLDASGEWELWQNQEGNGVIVGKSDKIMQFSSYLYDYVNDTSLGRTDDYIVTESGERLSEYDYISNENIYLLSVIIDYFGEGSIS